MRNKVTEKSNAGVTLIELLVGVFVFALVLVSVATFFNFFFDSYYLAYEGTKTTDEAKRLLDQMTKELREARMSEEGAFPLLTAGDGEIGFYVDRNNDGNAERVRYFLEETALKRGVIVYGEGAGGYDGATETVTVVSDYIQNGTVPIFYYYNGEWPTDTVNNPLVSMQRLLSTQMVEINLRVNSSPGTRSDEVVTSKVVIRNLKKDE